MLFGAYFCAGSFTFVLGLIVLATLFDGQATRVSFRGRVLRYVGLSVAISVLCLVAFVGLSYVTRLMRFGETTNWSYPGDYLASGPLGWVLMIIPLLGVVAPLVLALLLKRQKPAIGMR